MVKFFLDAFALMEIIKGNSRYEKYLDFESSTSLLNLYEMYYNLLKASDETSAKKEFLQFRQFVIQTNDAHIFAASKFKLEKRGLNISYADALGYAMAKAEGIKFLTGDRAFRGMDNVEFVK